MKHQGQQAHRHLREASFVNGEVIVVDGGYTLGVPAAGNWSEAVEQFQSDDE